MCDNPNLQRAFNQFHNNIHVATGSSIGPAAPGLHDFTGAELMASGRVVSEAQSADVAGQGARGESLSANTFDPTARYPPIASDSAPRGMRGP